MHTTPSDENKYLPVLLLLKPWEIRAPRPWPVGILITPACPALLSPLIQAALTLVILSYTIIVLYVEKSVPRRLDGYLHWETAHANPSELRVGILATESKSH